MSDSVASTPPIFSIEFPHAHGLPISHADFRVSPEDFVVDELLGFELSGEGEHYCMQLKKTGENTGWVAEHLAEYFAVKPMDVSFCGLKDRHAVTSQWFSVYLPKQPAGKNAEDFVAGFNGQLELLAEARHSHKLRRGQHGANRFTLVLRNLDTVDGLEERLQAIAEKGVPNYFGEQRFGREGNNLNWAQRWFADGEKIRSRNMRKMVVSAARSYLYNLVLAHRVNAENWLTPIEGEEFPTGPLWGRGRSVVGAELAELEAGLIAHLADWQNALEHQGLSQERRNLVLRPDDMRWQLSDQNLQLSMSLPPGSYATSVLREIAQLRNCALIPAEQVSD
ncbi:tRNA pseudouridine(13) synthase TruD [Teredinibacter waterburyi]|jgi:Uncharacterized conserved protein|uniref:tRNA pseudouridine(13) synthase TruD n=1 Tax=Teredinibacter waterburyi TaxID=1500538 RepID=UPI001FE5C22E|nr:tRNA pseudouridine(13) synthase TruD [Teredinibacter waterburyi]